MRLISTVQTTYCSVSDETYLHYSIIETGCISVYYLLNTPDSSVSDSAADTC